MRRSWSYWVKLSFLKCVVPLFTPLKLSLVIASWLHKQVHASRKSFKKTVISASPCLVVVNTRFWCALISCQLLYWFPEAAITVHHKVSESKISFLEPKSRSQQGCALSRGSTASLQCLPSHWDQASGGVLVALWSQDTCFTSGCIAQFEARKGQRVGNRCLFSKKLSRSSP